MANRVIVRREPPVAVPYGRCKCNPVEHRCGVKTLRAEVVRIRERARVPTSGCADAVLTCDAILECIDVLTNQKEK